MKTIRNIFLFASLLFAAQQAQAQTTVQSIEPFASKTIQFEVAAPAAVSGVDKSDNATLRIVVEVRGDIDNAQFQRIAKSGRYTFSSLSQADKSLKLTLPNLAKEIKIDGSVWREEIGRASCRERV